MTAALATLLLVAGVGLAAAAAARSNRRLQLGAVHPAFAWLALTVVFFAVGSLVLAAEGRPAAAAWTGAALVAFAAGTVASNAIARGRATDPGLDRAGAPRPAPRSRTAIVAALAVLGVVAILPTLATTGIPFLTPDITGARVEVAGLSVQVLRVTLPAAAALAVLGALRSPRPRRVAVTGAGVAVVAIAALEILLASRYLLAELVATLLLAVVLASHRLPIRAAAAVAGAGLVVFLGIQLARAWDEARGREVAFLAERTVSRVALVQPRTIDALIRVIPDEQPFFGGLTWARRLAPLVGRGDVPNLGYWIYPEVVAGQQAVAGYAAPGWLGEAWANLGPAGLSLFVLLGAAVERLAALIALRRRVFGGALPVADVAAAALAILFVARTHALGVNGLALLLVLLAAWRLLAAPGGGLLADVRATLAWRS